MQQFGPQYIGKPITIAAVRSWILQLKLTEADTVLLHPDDFDAIVLEYRATYGEPLPDPYFLLGAFVDDAININVVPKDRVTVLLDDDWHRRIMIAESFNVLDDDGGIIYRCRYCGNIISAEGEVLDADIRRKLIDLIKLRREWDNVVKLHGKCCPEVAA